MFTKEKIIVTIIIDPGHGGADPGAVGNGMRESDIVLETSLTLRTLLAAYENVNIIMTRERDTGLTLAQRVDIANRSSGALFISVHVNAGGGHGVETFFANTKPGDRVLAQHLTDNIAIGMSLRNRGARSDIISGAGSLTVLRNTRMSAVLIELAFIDAPFGHNDIAALRNNRRQFAEVIANSIARFYNLKKGGQNMTTCNCTPQPQRDINALAPWAQEAWQWAVLNNITDGTRPNDFITRQEVIALLHRFDNYLKK